MKKFFLMFAAAAVVIASCSKPEYIIPVDDDDEQKTDDPQNPNNGGGEEDGYTELTLTVDITLKAGINNNYDGTVGVMPGDKILDAFDMTDAEFYKAMGTYTGSAYPDPQTSQENNTIMFGVANGNNTDDFKWIPSSSNNFGHWFTAGGELCSWGDDAVFFTESLTEWGLEAPDAETLAGMWNFTVGCFPDRTKAGETYKATEVFFMTDDKDVEHYVYVQWVIKIEEGEAVELTVADTQEIVFNAPFNDSYVHTDLVSVIDMNALQAAIGIPYEDADVYGVNADGSFSMAPAKNFWFNTDGDIASWGAGAGICINDDAGTNSWAWCMYPDPDLGGKTLKGAIAFVNPDNLTAYVVKVVVNVEGIDYLAMDVLVSYENGESPYTLSEENLAALAEALGVESVAADEIGTNYALKGINADGSLYEGDFTANNGFWYSLEGNVANWNEIAAAGYVGAYIEYRGDYTFGCGMWEDTGVTATIKFGIANGDQLAVLTFNLEVAPPAQFETEEAGVMEVSTSQPIADGYGGGQIILNATDVAGLIGEGEYTLLSLEGKPDYTANGGFWFNADGEICGWGDGAVFYIEPTEDPTVFQTGIHPDNVTEAATLKASCRLANLETMKHITLNITIVAE